MPVPSPDLRRRAYPCRRLRVRDRVRARFRMSISASNSCWWELMPDPTARVWRRYGHLRIYISAGDVQLGWCDPRSGDFQLHQPAMAEDFWLAVRTECRRLEKGQLTDAVLPAEAAAEPGQPLVQQPARPPERPAGPRPAAQPPQPPAAQPPQPPAAQPPPATSSGPDGTHWIVRDSRWDDLARNAPGESARARAKELRAGHPFLVVAAKGSRDRHRG